MRKWRVGTVSMGLSLVLLGVFLVISQFSGNEAFQPLLVWWPAILVVLGIEILLYLFISKQENPIIKYDFLSILFVGVLGTVGIVLTVLTSTGLLQQVQVVVGSEETTVNLPAFEEKLSSEIKRVIVETGNQAVSIEGTEAHEIHTFGTYRAAVNRKEDYPINKIDDYVMTKVVGNTYYIYVKEPTQNTGPLSMYTHLNPTIVVPEDIRLEVRGQHNQIELHASSISNHWVVNGVDRVNVHVSENSDVKLSAVSRSDLAVGESSWEKVEVESGKEEEYNRQYKGTLTLGSGAYHLDIVNSEWVALHVLENQK
ncbi:hypothetical protein [Litchfieldia alkalitelluris]|uniref:hypothetical protein n=1 Tax=Litchfieldia alkalitelluris TaxID=304268 RepID=UPI00099750EA|nr:hypothetical protein [Litchfieldia alkalitelluris]